MYGFVGYTNVDTYLISRVLRGLSQMLTCNGKQEDKVFPGLEHQKGRIEMEFWAWLNLLWQDLGFR